jgi:hypothetical protein
MDMPNSGGSMFIPQTMGDFGYGMPKYGDQFPGGGFAYMGPDMRTSLGLMNIMKQWQSQRGQGAGGGDNQLIQSDPNDPTRFTGFTPPQAQPPSTLANPTPSSGTNSLMPQQNSEGFARLMAMIQMMHGGGAGAGAGGLFTGGFF